MDYNFAAVTLQTWWRFHSLRSKLNALCLNKSRETFEEYADLSTNRSTLDIVKQYLRTIGLDLFPVKVYLAAFMMYHWGEEVTGISLTKVGDTPQETLAVNVRARAERLVRMHFMIVKPSVGSPRKNEMENVELGNWESKREGVRHTSNRLELLMRAWHFKHVFDTWKKMDKDSIVSHMIYNYRELENCRNMMNEVNDDDPVNLEIKEYIDQQQDKIKRHVEELAGKESFDTLNDQYKSLQPSVTYGQLREVMHKAFWDKIADDLNQVPPVHEHTLVLFDDIKSTITTFIPNRKDLHSQMEEAVDSKFIDQMIKAGVFDHGELQKILIYLIDLIKTLQPPIEDKDTDEWRCQTIESCRKAEAWSILLPQFFKRIFRKLDGIKDGLRILKQ